MSSNVAISVSNVSKCYKIYDQPQDRLKQSLWRNKKKFYREFWALRDVSFDVKKGETVGIIGQNGSGKSTILQIIAGTLSPTSGEVKVNGRIAALLELGSGFNPEFTGRENIFLNGSIMGLSKDYIESRYDEIVSFADIGDFIDQPVKTYSSGMFVRLAFSVAVHSNPDILIVDEALSVGDALFQHRCIAKIKELVNDGVTLFFVSHSTEAIRSLCKRGIWLDRGKVRMIDDASKVSNAYLNEVFLEHNRVIINQLESKKNAVNNSVANYTTADDLEHKCEYLTATTDLSKNNAFKVHYVKVKNSQGREVENLFQGEEFTIEIKVSANVHIENLSIGILIKDEFGIELTGESIFNKFKKSISLRPGQSVVVSFRSKMLLRGGQSYSINLRINNVSKWDRSDNVLLYNEDAAAVFKVEADLEKPMWFKFYQDFEVYVDVF